MLVGLVAVLVGIVMWSLGPREPEYQGKPLSRWWDEFNDVSVAESSPADIEARTALFTNIVQSIGTNALPFYLSCLAYKPKPKWYDGIDNWLREKSSSRIGLPQTRNRIQEAYRCIEILGSAAEPAIPQLARFLSPDAPSCYSVALCLAAIGSPALPALSNAVATSSNAGVRCVVLEAMGNIGPQAQPASGLFLALVNRPESSSSLSLGDLALRAMVECETNRVNLMPLLLECLETNAAAGSAYGLACLGTAGFPVLLRAVTNDDSRVRGAAAAALELDLTKPYMDHPRWRFNRFHALFNLKLMMLHLGAYSTNEFERIKPVLFRYAHHEDDSTRIAATNALTHLEAVCTNVPRTYSP